MDVKKLVTITYACSNFKDEEINRIMQDRTARSTFLDIMDCYKIDDLPQKLECTLNKVLTKSCGKESQELFACIKQNPKNAKVCYAPTLNSQRCLDEQLHNLMMVSKGMN